MKTDFYFKKNSDKKRTLKNYFWIKVFLYKLILKFLNIKAIGEKTTQYYSPIRYTIQAEQLELESSLFILQEKSIFDFKNLEISKIHNLIRFK